MIEAHEVVEVADQEPARAERLDANRAGEELQLGEGGVGGSIGPDDPVRAEVGVVGLVAEVPAVGPVLPASVVSPPDPVVDPLPDEPALERAVTLEGREVVGEPTVRVAHAVRVLAEDHRPGVVALLGPRHDVVQLRVHRADDVRGASPTRPVVPDRALVVEGPRGVPAPDPACGCIVVRAVAALVAERPADHARVVLVAFDHVARPLEEGGAVPRIAADLVVVSVGLDVRLIDDVEPVAVAEIEPVGVVGVMRGAHGVDVRLLHELRIGLHQLTRDDASAAVVVIVSIDTADQKRPVIQEEAAIADLHRAEADVARRRLGPVAQNELVEPRLLSRPESRRAETRLEPAGEPLSEDDAAERIEQGGLEGPALRVDREHPVGVAAGKHVSDRPRRAQRHVPRDARVPPLVLILDEAGVGPAHDDGYELVSPAAADEVGDVELRRRPRVLCDPDRVAVDHDVQHPFGTSEAQNDPPPGPAARDRERAPVDAGRILLGHERRRLLERHHHVRVPGDVVAEHRPEARNMNRVPPTRLAECSGRVVGAPNEPELPVAVERPLE